MILNVDYLIIVSPIFTFLEVHNASVGLMRITITLCYYILLWAGSSDAWHTSSRFLIQKSKYVLNKNGVLGAGYQTLRMRAPGSGSICTNNDWDNSHVNFTKRALETSIYNSDADKDQKSTILRYIMSFLQSEFHLSNTTEDTSIIMRKENETISLPKNCSVIKNTTRVKEHFDYVATDLMSPWTRLYGNLRDIASLPYSNGTGFVESGANHNTSDSEALNNSFATDTLTMSVAVPARVSRFAESMFHSLQVARPKYETMIRSILPANGSTTSATYLRGNSVQFTGHILHKLIGAAVDMTDRMQTAALNTTDSANVTNSVTAESLNFGRVVKKALHRTHRFLELITGPKPEILSDSVLAFLAADVPEGEDPLEVKTETMAPPVQTRWRLLPNSWYPVQNASTEAIAPTSEEESTRELIKQIQALPVTKAGGFLARGRRTELAIAAALAVNSELSAKAFAKHVGIELLLAALLGKGAKLPFQSETDRAEVIRALNKLVRYDKPLAAVIAGKSDVVSALCDWMERPLGFRMFQSTQNRATDLRYQLEAADLVNRLVRSSDVAVSMLRHNERLRKVLSAVAGFATAPVASSLPGISSEWAKNAVKELNNAQIGSNVTRSTKVVNVRKRSDMTTVGEYDGLSVSQLARVAAWGLGGVQWRPRSPGQRGLRILSLDGGGTRGVLSIALLREIMKRVNRDLEPHQMFDIICGTSTGGIIATLLGSQRVSLADAEVLYDAFIGKIFGSRSSVRLFTAQAAYDVQDWENILHEMCGDQLLLDSNQHDCPRVFCISAKANTNPPEPNLWRNYNYPPGQTPRYPGACRVNTFTAIRATTAAPTFFTPVQWQSGLYYDGAMVANNPTAIALQEAKLIYPKVPVELVVSIGTGYLSTHSPMSSSMGWDVLVNQLIAASTDTEDVHALLHDLLPTDKYFRFNPILPDALRIDEKNKTVLSSLKSLARKSVEEIEGGSNAKAFNHLVKVLRS